MTRSSGCGGGRVWAAHCTLGIVIHICYLGPDYRLWLWRVGIMSMSMGMETPCPDIYNIYILSIHRIYNIYILSIDRVNMPGKLRQVSPEHVWLCRVTYRVNRASYFLPQPHPRGWFESEWTRLTNLCPDSTFNILLYVSSSRMKRECLTISNHLPSTNQQQWHWQSKLVFSLVYTGKLT